MPLVDDIQYGFVSGEVSPTLIGRADLEKYDLGLALARNFFIDPRGGLASRPGTIFVDYVLHDDKPTKFFPFKFAPALTQTYVMLFGDKYIRFLQDGAYVLEPGKTITGIAYTSGQVKVTATAHGFSNGDWVKVYDVDGPELLNQQTYIVADATTDTFNLKDTYGDYIPIADLPAYVSGGEVLRIYTVTTPYAADDLHILRAHQSRSQITLTHPDYKPRALIRVSDTNWTLAKINFGNQVAAPTGLAITSSTAGTSGVGIVVTAVTASGEEGMASDYAFNTTVANIVVTPGTSLKYTWTAVPGAVSYRVYRTQITPVGADITRSQPLGFIGMSFGPEFVDNNIVPNYSETPPMYLNPFADGAVEFIQVTAGGSGYSNTSTVSITGGTGFVGQPVVSGGVLLGIVVVKGGKGYSGSSVVSVSGGTGATVVVELSPAAGNNPAVSTVFQQRQVFAATDNDPLTVWGSKPKLYNNFDYSVIPAASDSYEFELDSDEVAPIRHLIPTRQGLTMMSQAGIWRLSSSDGIVRATDAIADPESYVGCSLVPPLVIDTDIVYIEGKGQTVRLLTYSDYQKLYMAQDLSILSSHLMTSATYVESWGYASDPFKLVHAVRSDGALLTMTLLKEQNVYAWTQNWTKGLYRDVLCLQEGNTDTVYYMTQRFINGRWTKYIEKAAIRAFPHVEEAWCVDSGLANAIYTPVSALFPSAAEGNDVPFYADPGTFSAGDVDSVIRVGGGLAKVTSFVSDEEVLCSIIRPLTDVIQEDPEVRPIEAGPGEWSLDKPIQEVGGLGHLEGEVVKILADGAVLPDQEVVNGKVTLQVPATRIIIGLGFRAIAKTLPLAFGMENVVENKQKRYVRTAVRLHESRGLKTGTDPLMLRELKERTDERYGEATLAKTGLRVATVEDVYDLDNAMYYVQDYPLPLTVLGFINEVEVSESSNG